MELAVKLGCVAVAGCLCALTVRRYVPELALTLSLVTASVLIVLILGSVVSVQEGFLWLAEQSGLDSALTSPVYKVTLIAIFSRLTSQICRDAGEGTVAVCCELAGTFAALGATLPLLRQVVELLKELML